MTKIEALSLGYIVAKLRDLSLLDPIDIAILNFIEEKYGGVAPLGEINALVVLGALAPRWKEMMKLPAVQPLIPEELLSAITTNLAEKELETRLTKLESMGLIEKLPPTSSDDKGKVILTDLGKAIVTIGGIPLDVQQHTLKALLDKLKIPFVPQEKFVLQPGDKVIVVTNEILTLSIRELALIIPAIELSMFGMDILNKVVVGPFNDRVELILRGGIVPVVLERGQQIAYVIRMRSE